MRKWHTKVFGVLGIAALGWVVARFKASSARNTADGGRFGRPIHVDDDTAAMIIRRYRPALEAALRSVPA